jgi:hypothetical protein
MEFIQSERGNQKLNIKLKKNCGGQLSGGLLSCSPSGSIESERGNQKLNIKLKKICGGQLS